jgi:hypothetical protein
MPQSSAIVPTNLCHTDPYRDRIPKLTLHFAVVISTFSIAFRNETKPGDSHPASLLFFDGLVVGDYQGPRT